MTKNLLAWGALVTLALVPLQAHSHTSQAWHQLSPSKRGLKIVSAALSGLGSKGYNCKRWLQEKVIVDVTDGHVFLPRNSAEPGDSWVDDSNGHISKIGKDFSKARAGDIVQMITRFTSGEQTSHTAVIVEVNAKRLVLIESNFAVKNTVTKRELTIDAFQKSTVGNQYTIYRVN